MIRSIPILVRAGDADSGKRVDVLLAEAMPELSRSAAQRLLAEGRVTKGNRAVAKNYRAAPGDVFAVSLPEPTTPGSAPQDIPLDVRYEDEDLIVVNKPRGMVVHPAPGHADGTLVNALLHHCGESLSGVGGVSRPGIVHRIDRDTSGLIIAAKNDFAHTRLAAQLAAHTLARVYETVARGALPEDRGTIDLPIGRHPTHRLRQAVTTAHSRPAVTRYEVLARYPGFTHARCRLETGRTHQIRVHLAHIGHPILGDALYGGQDRRFALAGQCLHARTLRFVHPRTGLEVAVETELPDYFAAILRQLER
ncbi:MAG: RluA family pseudouridine synthase [Oscillospiraceae bacterium]|jgi:23S rRNA pseudouridine1911/1915/1917 synthase|nr:RluA family pseudouridine synthase [Oscillospiraceae bacterium]